MKGTQRPFISTNHDTAILATAIKQYFLANFFKLFLYRLNEYEYLTPLSFFLAGQDVFRSFLKSEFSEENIEFWLACEDYKKTESDLLHCKAEKIYKAFVHSDAAKQVSIKFIIILLCVKELRCRNSLQHTQQDEVLLQCCDFTAIYLGVFIQFSAMII